MHNFIYLLEGEVVFKVTAETTDSETYTGEFDTVTTDPSGQFNVGDTYTIEQWEDYNLSLEDFKARKAGEIDAKAEEFMDSNTPKYPEFEKHTFPKQEAEAKAYLDNPNADVPCITKIATQRGVAVDVLANLILVKATAFSDMAVTTAGKRQNLHTTLAQATTVAQVKGLEVNYG